MYSLWSLPDLDRTHYFLIFTVFNGDPPWDQLVHLITHSVVVDIFKLRIEEHDSSIINTESVT